MSTAHIGRRHASRRHLRRPSLPYDEDVVRPTTHQVTAAQPQSPLAAEPGRGDLVGGRYLLEVRCTPASDARPETSAVLWRAEDLVLSRPVAVRLLWDAPAKLRQVFLSTATALSRNSAPLLAATYDAAEELFPPAEPDPDHPAVADSDAVQRPACYVVREWVEGSSLAELLTDGPLPPKTAAALFRDAASALAQLHEQGYAHGRVNPANLMVRTDGQLRICDAGIARALALAADDRPLEATEADFEADLRGLGQSMYAALTGRWPGSAWRGLPTAPRSGVPPADSVLTPRHVRAGVPRHTDEVVAALLDLEPTEPTRALRTAADVAQALRRGPTGPAFEPEAAAPLRPYRTPRPLHRRAGVAAVAIVIVGLTAALVASVHHDNSRPTAVPAFTALPTTAGSTAKVVVPIAALTSFDPPPGDGSEYPDEVGLAHDGKQGTAWRTQQYTSRDFGHLKPGVGLLVDLGRVRRITEVDVTFPRAGSSVELRAMPATATTSGARLKDYPLVAAQSNVGQAVALRSNVSARYWLVWLTALPPDGGGYRGGISELAFRS